MKKIMILGASILQLPAIIKAKEMGLQAIAVDMDEQAIGFKYADICLPVSTIDIPSVVKAAGKYEIDGIMTLASDMPMRTVAEVSKQLHLIGISEETAFKATNKAAMRRCFLKNSVPIPVFYEVRTKNEFYDAVNSIEGKSIVKPVDNAGSRGVTLLGSDNFEILEKAFSYAMQCSRSGSVMVEEYMEGPEASVETLSVDGVCHVIQITDKLTTGAPHFIEMGHNQPSMLSDDIKERIARVTCTAVNAIGINNGPSHTEIKLTKNGPKLVEIGARLGGDCITTDLVPLSTGVDMVECCIHIALGEKPDLEPKFTKASAIRYVSADIGHIEDINGIEEAQAIHGVKKIGIVHGVGEESVEVLNSVDRVAFVIAQADDPQTAIQISEDGVSRIKYITSGNKI